MKSIDVRFESRPARDHFRIATTCLELAKRATEEWEVTHHCVTGIAFTAFSIEAMLNHFGKIFFDDWNDEKSDRKSAHKKLFKEVNLPNYLGSKEYQTAKKCFAIRDALAHGKTIREKITVDTPDNTESEDDVCKKTSIGSKQYRDASYEMLKAFVEAARKIEKDIEDNGFYPNPHLAEQDRSELSECPLSTGGISVW